MRPINLYLSTYLFTVTTAQQLTTSIFVPREYLSNTFDVSIAGVTSQTTTFLFSPGCAFGPCGPVRLTQGPGTAIYTEDNVPTGGVTTAWTCSLSPEENPTTADCTVTSTAPWGCCEGRDTTRYPPGTGFAFPTYRAVVTAGGDEAVGTGGGVGRPTETVFTQNDPGAPATTAMTTPAGTTMGMSMSGSEPMSSAASMATSSMESQATSSLSMPTAATSGVDSASSTESMASTSTAGAQPNVQVRKLTGETLIAGILFFMAGLRI